MKLPEKKANQTPEVDIFKDMYYEVKQLQQTDKDVAERDITEELDIYIDHKIDYGELVNGDIRGEPGTGKSVVALELMRRTNEKLSKKFKKVIDNYSNIASDQNEFLRLSKRPEENVCIEIDEWSSMGKTGANATTEMAEYEFFSDLCRIYYKHRWACSPQNIIDKNAYVILDILGKDMENKKTCVKILYRNPLEGQMLPLGTAWIDVSKTIDSKWYKRYEKKKKLRVDLMNKHGIRDIRELEYADIAIDVIRDMQGILAAIGKGDILPLIRLKAVATMQKKYQRPTSFIAEDEIIKPIVAILQNIRNAEKVKTKEAKKIIMDVVEDEVKRLKWKRALLKEYMNIEVEEE